MPVETVKTRLSLPEDVMKNLGIEQKILRDLH